MNDFIPKDVGGVKVDRVMVSQASHAMANGYSTCADVEREVQYIHTELQELNQKDKQNQARLAELNNKVMGRKVDPSKYRSICDEQVKLKKPLASAGARRGELKTKLSQLRSVGAELAPKKEFKKGATEALLVKILGELRLLNARIEKIASNE